MRLIKIRFDLTYYKGINALSTLLKNVIYAHSSEEFK